MGLINKILVAASTFVTASTLTGIVAQANPIYIGYSLDGGSTINSVGTSSEGFRMFNFGTDSFVVTAYALTAPNTSQGSLISTISAFRTFGPATIDIYLSSTNNTLDAVSFTTEFDNTSGSTNSVTERSYVTPGNNPFGGLYKLATATQAPLTSSSTTTALGSISLGTPYTLTSVYSITYGSAGGSTTASINVQANEATSVPEPVSLALLGAGLIGVSIVRRRGAE